MPAHQPGVVDHRALGGNDGARGEEGGRVPRPQAQALALQQGAVALAARAADGQLRKPGKARAGVHDAGAETGHAALGAQRAGLHVHERVGVRRVGLEAQAHGAEGRRAVRCRAPAAQVDALRHLQLGRDIDPRVVGGRKVQNGADVGFHIIIEQVAQLRSPKLPVACMGLVDAGSGYERPSNSFTFPVQSTRA